MNSAPWIWEMVPGYLTEGTYRWVEYNRVIHNDATGVTITYRRRHPDHVICGARTMHPGFPNAKKDYPWRADQSVPHEAVCTIVGDHAEVPHVGVPADCADMICRCSDYGSFHLVIVSLTIRTPNPQVKVES